MERIDVGGAWVSDTVLQQLREIIAEGSQWKLADMWGIGGPTIIKGLVARIDRLEDELRQLKEKDQ